MTQQELEMAEFNGIMLLFFIAAIWFLALVAWDMYKHIKYYYRLGKRVEEAKKTPRKVPTVLREEWRN